MSTTHQICVAIYCPECGSTHTAYLAIDQDAASARHCIRHDVRDCHCTEVVVTVERVRSPDEGITAGTHPSRMRRRPKYRG